jgi:lysophospholipase L1-like esterase
VKIRLAGTLAILVLARSAVAAPGAGFHLRRDDRVVFYGDSITDARMYTSFVESYVLTRFPTWDVRFVHSGWGGDRVDGGSGGRIDRRLERDVLAYKPTVITVMLGMNDGRYRPYDPAVYQRYVAGYENLIDTLKAELPQARITVMQPSPYDEITRPPLEGGGYTPVLLRFGAFVKQLAQREHLGLADLNSDLTGVLTRLNARDHDSALKLIPDRVHPGVAGHLVLASSLLQAWRAPALVSSVEIDAAHTRVVAAAQSKVSDLARDGAGLRWSQVDGALPMPIDSAEPLVADVLQSSNIVEKLDQQPLKITGLGEGPYALRIDDQQVGVFRGPALARGINLATLPTPMARQALEVHALTLKHNDIHNTRWRYIQLRLDHDGVEATGEALAALDTVERELIQRQHSTARPRLRRYALQPVSPVASNVPPGFTPVGSGDLRRVLLGSERLKDLEVYLEIDGSESDAAASLLLRVEGPEGYRVNLDAREDGQLGRVEAIGIPAVPSPIPAWRAQWKKGEWNAVRVHIDGDKAHVLVSLNGVQITDWTDHSGHLYSPDSDGWGLTAIELPPAELARPLRFRNVALRRLR